MMTDAELIAAFVASRGVTRCPSACLVKTTASPSGQDREALGRHFAEREARKAKRGPLPLAA